ncbi:MAG: energy-coupling factor transporter ATPase [Bacillota bacterium]|nr:energy-coupling factor transporter ATPase [Bacillota bacterium]
MIEIRDLHFQYETEQPVLRGLDLEIREGEWLALIGANGSGKSTLARQLNGLLLPNSGTVCVDGLRTDREEELWKIRSQVAFVFQNPDNQLIATSVEDDIAFALENLGFPPEEITGRVEQALSEMNLTGLRAKAPHLLSGGEKQRVAIAGALAMASKYLVLDEPTSMLDPSMRRSVLESLQQLHEKHGLSIIYITNIMEETLLADRILVLDEGRILRDETPAALFADCRWLRAKQLDIPQVSRLAELLLEQGYEQFRGVLSPETLMEIVCK